MASILLVVVVGILAVEKTMTCTTLPKSLEDPPPIKVTPSNEMK
jgi:hypothetical protein